MASTLHPAKAAPMLKIPNGASAKVSIIDTTSRIQAPVGLFMHPAIPGHEHLNAPAFSFLVEQQKSSRKVLFDLGLRKDWQSHPPAVLKLISGPGWAMEIQKNVAEILQENGVDVAGGSIEAVIWSHWHFDHTGDVSTFPYSTKLIAGAGVKDAFLPAYPNNSESSLLESDFAGREYEEIDFDKRPTLEIGNYRGIDYFGDGSFYVLDAPGHAIGHVVGLARVTSTQDGDPEDTFVLMGADTAHHGGEFRPTEYLPIPKDITPSPYVAKYASACPGHIFESIHPRKKGADPFYHLHDEVPHNKQQADRSCELMQEFDAADNVFVIIAHDATLLDSRVGIDWYPHGDLKNWKAKDSDNKARWLFLQDFTQALE
ncbi:uncharacterized protein PV07_05118 [Cladophialophora immunda]|uniref:Metallo-beta-lactamase domain-containing protein n=1 Tax=Cladophialophora immunda TaxID=569365 RepID=A0A0D2CDR0_9EURO|nr:uncharacterized protein PV07_05118 [Cladophialophora immunda]KIW29293.1 hypothetical protein PV07_05118 [Cladophialophora immunda]OQV08476.1 hypothetical protein CLAIMM_12741 [Cladophialophora immunda]